ncbi:hypothetical protein, partial [Actinoplanes utahensis]
IFADTVSEDHVEVSQRLLTLNNHLKVYDYGATATFTARLGSTYKNRTVEFWADPYGDDQGRRLLKKVVVDSRGEATVALKVHRNTAVQAIFTGDALFADRLAASVVYVKVPVSLAATNHYTTTKIDGVGYKVFRKNAGPILTVTMPKHPNRTAYLATEVFVQGKWRAQGAGYARPDAAGRFQVRMNTTNAGGLRFRVRAAYVAGGSGDNLNATSYTPYQYLYISK